MTLGALRVCANLDWPLTFGLPVLSKNNLQNISFGKVHDGFDIEGQISIHDFLPAWIGYFVGF